MITLDHAAINCNESTGTDKLLSDRYSRIHFSNSGLFLTIGAGSGLISAISSLLLLAVSAVVVVVFSSGLEVPSVG